jgi:hypothetical protein
MHNDVRMCSLRFTASHIAWSIRSDRSTSDAKHPTSPDCHTQSETLPPQSYTECSVVVWLLASHHAMSTREVI